MLRAGHFSLASSSITGAPDSRASTGDGGPGRGLSFFGGLLGLMLQGVLGEQANLASRVLPA
jgi:hypothetical protein